MVAASLHSLKKRISSFSPSTIFAGILLGAFVIRIGFLLVVSPVMDARGELSVDASSYHAIARNLVERRIFTSPVDPPYNPDLPGTFRPPLTPFFLAAMYAMFGTQIFWGRLGLAFVSALSCGLTYVLGERIFGRWTGLLAGCISCVYPFFLLLVHIPLTEGLSIFLMLVLFTVMVLYHPHQNAIVQTVILGVVFGLLMLNKAANIAILPCLLLWIFWKPQITTMKRVLLTGLLILCAVLVILPWTIRNYRILGIIVPVNTNGGWTFYLGNNPHTDKNLSALEQGTATGWVPPEEVFAPFADLSFHDTKAYEQRSVKLGVEFIREYPGTFLVFGLRKLQIFWSAYPHVLDKLAWYPIAVLGAVGIILSCSSWKRYVMLYLLILSSLSIPFMFTSMPRFRAPLMPVMLLFASSALVKTGQWYANRH